MRFAITRFVGVFGILASSLLAAMTESPHVIDAHALSQITGAYTCYHVEIDEYIGCEYCIKYGDGTSSACTQHQIDYHCLPYKSPFERWDCWEDEDGCPGPIDYYSDGICKELDEPSAGPCPFTWTDTVDEKYTGSCP